MKKFKKILVPLDGSKTSESILSELEELAVALDAKIALLRVVYMHVLVSDIDHTEAQAKLVREAEEYLNEINQRLQARGFDVESHVRYGEDADEILNHAAQEDIDLILMCTHGRSGVKRWLLGSVAEKVLRHATKPVFLIRRTE